MWENNQNQEMEVQTFNIRSWMTDLKLQYGRCDTVYGKLPEEAGILSSYHQAFWKLFPFIGSALKELISILWRVYLDKYLILTSPRFQNTGDSSSAWRSVCPKFH